jgi:hypothetical protein
LKVVSLSDAVIYPDAMMVGDENASVANATMFGSSRLDDPACRTLYGRIIQ